MLTKAQHEAYSEVSPTEEDLYQARDKAIEALKDLQALCHYAIYDRTGDDLTRIINELTTTYF